MASTVLDDTLTSLGQIEGPSEQHLLLIRLLESAPFDDLARRLKDESERYLPIDPRVSLRLAEALVRVAELARRPDRAPLGLLAKGDALRFLGNYPESLAIYDAAGEQFLAHRDEVGWARTRAVWLVSSHFLGRGPEGLRIADGALAVLVRHGEWLRAGALSLNAGAVCWELGRYDQALERYARAIRFYNRARRADPTLADTVQVRIARAKLNIAEILTGRGDFRRALALYAGASDVFERHGAVASWRKAQQYAADAYAGQGHYIRALRLYTDVLAAAERANDDLNAALVRLQMAECYLSVNQNAMALDLATEAERALERCGTPTETAKARVDQALARARLGEVDQALVLLEQAVITFQGAGLTHFQAIATLQRAGLHLETEEWPAALVEAERAGQVFAERGMIARQAQAELVQARAALGLGRVEVAADLATSALGRADDHGLGWLAQEGHHVRSMVARARGDLALALDECRAAIADIERVQSRLAPTLRISFLEDKLAVYDATIDLGLRLARPDLALAYLERAKSRALVDYLASNLDVRLRARSPADQELLDNLTRLREEHNWLANRLYGDRRDGADTGIRSDDEVRDLQAAVRDREKRIGWIFEQLSLRDAEALGSIAPLALVDDSPPDVDERTVVLEYFLRNDVALVFVVAHGEISALPLAVSADGIVRLLNQWHLNLAATGRALAGGQPLDGLGRNARGILEALYRALIQPAERFLGGVERLVVVPFGPTHAVPFHALHDGRRYLLERLEVSTAPSSSLLRLCARRPRRAGFSSLVVAHGDGGRLPWVVEEARAVASLVPGESFVDAAATRAALFEAAPRHAIVHLAAHAEARLDNPTFAHLKLADGQLSAIDVLNLRLDGALVTLSGCETGRSVVAAGDELIGLSRAFLFGGAVTLVQSLWRVEDVSTARLMERFYRAIGAGKSASAALRRAQLANLVESGDHPYFWAAFQLVGDGGVSPGR